MYLELVPAKSIRHTDEFDDPKTPGVIQTKVSLDEVFCGTELTVAWPRCSMYGNLWDLIQPASEPRV